MIIYCDGKITVTLESNINYYKTIIDMINSNNI